MDDLRLTPAQEANLRRLGRPLAPREDFVRDVAAAVRAGRGFAAGRIGMSQKHWLYYPILLARAAANPKVYRLFETRLIFHGLNQEGVFPPDPAFYLRFNEFYLEHLRRLDYLGLYLNDWDIVLERPILDFYGLPGRLVHYQDLHPDRQAPSRPEDCYLPAFEGRTVLLVCPFASLLRERATRPTFERVWAKIGKRWFFPAAVEALDIPYGFARTTRARYPTALEMFEAVADQIAGRRFDVALIAAGGLAVPLAAHVKGLGKVGLDLGGHLQIVFGVLGRKWRRRPAWRDAYFTPDWLDMPARYRPDEDNVCVEDGEAWAFW